jgi:hypothetical protein
MISGVRDAVAIADRHPGLPPERARADDLARSWRHENEAGRGSITDPATRRNLPQCASQKARRQLAAQLEPGGILVSALIPWNRHGD